MSNRRTRSHTTTRLQPPITQLKFTAGLPVEHLQSELLEAYRVTGLGSRNVARYLIESFGRRIGSEQLTLPG